MITQEQLREIGDWIGDRPIGDDIDRLLRQRFSGIHFTHCMDDDIVGAEPVYGRQYFNLYLVDSSSQCLAITQNPESASGLVIAEIEKE